MKQTVAVLGEGAWGTAFSTVLAHNGYTVKLWCNDPHVVDTITTLRINERYMPGIKLSNLILPVASLKEAIEEVDYIFEAIPVKFMRSVLTQVQPFVKTDQYWIALSKGIEQETLMLPSAIIKDVIGSGVKVAVCVGPSFADEVIRQKFTAVILAASDKDQSEKIKKIVENEYFRIYESEDIIGPQVGAALKNVIALGVGILEGSCYGENTKAYLLTRALEDMATCAQALGGKRDTIYGLSGLGDLMLTCKGGLSRNVRVGTYFGKGLSLEKVIEENGLTPEGVNTVKSICDLAQKHKISLPVCHGIHEMLFNGKSVEAFLSDLS